MSPRMLRYWAAFVVALGCLVFARPSEAHPSPTSVAFVDFTVDGALLEQTVPLSELEAAVHRAIVRDGETARQSVDREASFLRDYVRAHVRLSQPGSEDWVLSSLDLDGNDAKDGPELRFVMRFRTPRGALEAGRNVTLVDDVVAHEVVTHYLSIYLRSDWSEGVLARREPQLLGTVHAGRVAIEVPRTGSFFRGVRSVVGQGVEHITTGTDHLVFLFSLLLVVPAVASHGRWSGVRGTRQAIVALLRVVTAFTLGHSLTLTLGALRVVELPEALVEAAIAGSIVVTAVHAARPLFPDREALVAAGFGLVHGLAFASSLAGRDLGRMQTACTVLAFNVGIELAQLALVAFVVPWLLLLARTSFFPRFRIAGAIVAGALALGWLAERCSGLRPPTSAVAAWLGAHPVLVLVTFAATACAGRLYDSQRVAHAGRVSS
ncbi:MAG: HupE/UreJ family protein [Myxococcales bacterium]|nr:HupE/UreJ family protein [Myxococcales bacterium]